MQHKTASLGFVMRSFVLEEEARVAKKAPGARENGKSIPPVSITLYESGNDTTTSNEAASAYNSQLASFYSTVSYRLF